MADAFQDTKRKGGWGVIEFKCEQCGAAMEAPDSLAGQPEKCPNCGLPNRVLAGTVAATPAPAVQAPGKSSELGLPSDIEGQFAQETGAASSQQDKPCPYCGETIKAAAILCRFCGMNLQTGRPVHSETQQQREVPRRVTYNPQHDAFHGTLPLMVRLAVKAVHEVGFKLENASDSAGIVTFRTGVTWGSWSGVSGSIAIEDAGEDWFHVSGDGKQNVQGGQVLAIDLFGEAKSKAKRVIAQMKVLAR